MMRGAFPVFYALPLWMSFGSAAALREPQLCYVLDGLLFLYGLILTVLYCRLRCANHAIALGQQPGKVTTQKQENGQEGIYQDLSAHAPDTYETIRGQKKLKALP